MNERRLRDALKQTRPPDAPDARERARAVARAGYESRPRGTAPARRTRLPALAAVAAGLVAVAIALTPPGDAIAGWVRHLVRGASDAPHPQPALGRLPDHGRLLVSGPGGAWIVQPDGGRRRLGNYRDATWSPQGLYVGVTSGRELAAVDPRGTVRWVLSQPAPVRDPRWSPDGLHVAYRSGDSLRVVEGDGDNDRLISWRVPAVAAAWRPTADQPLAYVGRTGQIAISDAAGRRIATLHPGLRVQRLEWSADGARLLVVGPRGVRVLDGAGRVVTRVDSPVGSHFLDAALSPSGGRIAIVAVRPSNGRHEVLLASARTGRVRSAFPRVAGVIRSVTWSPSGRVVLADWVGSDQWLFLPTSRGGGASAVAGIAAHFDPGRTRPRGGVRIEGWCCP